MNYNELVEGLIDTNKQYRKIMDDKNRLVVSPVFYAIEFCTVAVDIGRGVGKTTFIRNHAKKGDLVFVVNLVAKRIHYGNNTQFDVIAFDEIDKTRGRRFETVYVDEPAAVFTNDIDKKLEMYRLLVDPLLHEQTFVLLGRQ